MPSKLTNERLDWVRKKRDEGLSDREISRLSHLLAAKSGGNARGVSPNTIRKWLDDSDRAEAEAKAAAGEQLALPAPVVDDSQMTPEEFSSWLAVQLRQAQAASDAARASGDIVGAQRATKLASTFAALLQKQHARTADDGEVVRVKATDMAAAAERAWSGLEQQANAVLAEVERWPRCSGCGQPHGDFAPGADRSRVRALFERVARRTP